jgi:type I restriction enzyme S subunit
VVETAARPPAEQTVTPAAELPEGFKLTEIGPLPEEWRLVTLRDTASRAFGGGTPSTKRPEFWDGVIPWTTSAVIGEDDIRLLRFQRCISEEALRQSATRIAPKGSLLIGTRVGVGKAVATTFDVAINQDLTALVVSNDVCAEYLALALKEPRIQRWFGNTKRGTTIKGVPRADVLNLSVPLPPLNEQRAIARVLSTIQRAIEATDRVIAAARQLKRSLMRHLFTYGPVPLADAERIPLKETEIGPVPGHWDVVRLGDRCGKPQYGYTETATANPVGPKFLRITDIQENGVEWAAVPHCRCAQPELAKYVLESGDILIARIGATTGKSYLTRELQMPAVFASYLIRVRTRPELDAEYLYYFLNSEAYWAQVNAYKEDKLKKGISGSALADLRLPFAPLEEQRYVARALRRVDRKIETEEKRRAALKELFRTMLHLLMTGQVRVKPEAGGLSNAGS